MAAIPSLNFILADARIGLMADDSAPAIKYEKSDLKILFVGHNPEDSQLPFKDLATGRTYELYRNETLPMKHF